MRISDWSSDVCSSDLQLVEDIEREDRADRELRVGMRRGEGGDGVVVERGDEKAGPARQRGEIGGDARETVVGHVEAGDAQADHPIVGRGADGEGDGADAPFGSQPHRRWAERRVGKAWGRPCWSRWGSVY